MSASYSVVEGTKVDKWTFSQGQTHDVYRKCMSTLKVFGLLGCVFHDKAFGSPISAAAVDYVEDIIFKRISDCLGESYSQCLKAELKGPTVHSYRFCGGSIFHIMTNEEEKFLSDIDLYVTPVDDVEFVRRISTSAPVTSLVNTDVTEKSPQLIHDVKVMATSDGPVVLDIVFRKECDVCNDVDVYACKSGLYGSGHFRVLEFYDFPTVAKNKVHVAPFISESRCAKMNTKGFTCIPLYE
jgi:hypothetical protein